jgi:hypothetical protein
VPPLRELAVVPAATLVPASLEESPHPASTSAKANNGRNRAVPLRKNTVCIVLPIPLDLRGQ